MMATKEAARRSCNYDTRQKASTSRLDKKIITDYERGTHCAGLALFGMFVFFIGWMWFTW